MKKKIFRTKTLVVYLAIQELSNLMYRYILLFFCLGFQIGFSQDFEESRAALFEEQQLPVSEETIITDKVIFNSNAVVLSQTEQPRRLQNALSKYQTISENNIAIDTVPNVRKGLFRKLPCKAKSSLEIFGLGLELTRFAKPPKAGSSEFLYFLYLIYVIPLLFIIAAFMLIGVGFIAFYVAMAGLFSFLIYWGVLALSGIALTGAWLLWGILGAAFIGLIVFIWLVRTCKRNDREVEDTSETTN